MLGTDPVFLVRAAGPYREILIPYLVQDTDIPVQKHSPFVLSHVHCRGVQLQPAHVTQERSSIRAKAANKRVSLLLSCSSYIIDLFMKNPY